MTEHAAARPAPLQNRSLPVAIGLGITTTISYGTLYYAFGVVAPEMSRDTGLSLTIVYGLFSASLFGAALVAPFTGRAFDRYGPARMMALGSVVSAALLFLLSALSGPIAFAALLVAAQMAATMVLYEAAFATVAHQVAGRARRTVTIITLIAGFSSTIFWPLTVWLGQSMSWREIYALFALLHVVVNLPLHLWLSGAAVGKRRKSPPPAAETVEAAIGAGGPRRQAFFLMMAAFGGLAFTIGAVHLHLIGLLGEIGLAASAPLIGSLIGPAQVFGRVIDFFSGSRVPVIRILLFSTLTLPAALVLLAAGPAVLPVAAAAAIVFGLGQGVTFIARGVLPLELFGSKGYGALIGKFNAISLVAMATAPVVAAAVREAYGARATMLVVAAVSAAAALSALRLNSLLKRM